MPAKIFPSDSSKYPTNSSHREALDVADGHTNEARNLMQSALSKTTQAFAMQDAEKARDAARKARQTINGLAMTGFIDEGETVNEFLQRFLTGHTIQNIQEQTTRVDRAAKVLRFGGTIAEAADSYNSPTPSAEDWWQKYLTKLQPVSEPVTTGEPYVGPTLSPITDEPTTTATETKSSKLLWIGGAVAALAFVLTRKKKRK